MQRRETEARVGRHADIPVPSLVRCAAQSADVLDDFLGGEGLRPGALDDRSTRRARAAVLVAYLDGKGLAKDGADDERERG
jgi:hypothetical protein